MSVPRVTREQVLAFRGRDLVRRLPPGARSRRAAARAGLQDSVPRAAVLSLHARVDGVDAGDWDAPDLVQLWGPRFNVYVVAAEDLAVFSLGRLPRSTAGRERAERLADRLAGALGETTETYAEAGRMLGESPNMLRYAATTGRVVLRWDGARRPTIRMVRAPDVDPDEARLELARRFLRVFGPATGDDFRRWAGVAAGDAATTFAALEPELSPVESPIGDALILGADEDALLGAGSPTANVRLLPSGDAHWLWWGEQRALLVPDERRRGRLWTPRVWPGAVVVDGEVAGTWRRAGAGLTVSPWGPVADRVRDEIEAEAAALPLDDAVTVTWS